MKPFSSTWAQLFLSEICNLAALTGGTSPGRRKYAASLFAQLHLFVSSHGDMRPTHTHVVVLPLSLTGVFRKTWSVEAKMSKGWFSATG